MQSTGESKNFTREQAALARWDSNCLLMLNFLPWIKVKLIKRR
jgi:hypothetical protein